LTSVKFEFILILPTTQPHLQPPSHYPATFIIMYITGANSSWHHPHVYLVITNHGCRSKVCEKEEDPIKPKPKPKPTTKDAAVQVNIPGPCYEAVVHENEPHPVGPDGDIFPAPFYRTFEARALTPPSRCVPCIARGSAPRRCLPAGASCKKIFTAWPQVSDCGACSMCVPTPGSNGTFARCVNFW
jgi:hypothetical protein